MKLLIADDHELFAEGLRSMLLPEPDMNIVGKVSNGNEVLAFVRRQIPDVVLLDMNMPQLNGIEVAKVLISNYPSLKIIILTSYAEQKFLEEFKRIGVHGYVLKTVSKQELLTAIRQVHHGSQFYVDSKMILSTIQEPDSFLKKHNLTKRELEIIQLIKQGLTSQEIASTLFLSILTVETHRKNIHLKLNVKNNAELLRFATENGL